MSDGLAREQAAEIIALVLMLKDKGIIEIDEWDSRTRSIRKLLESEIRKMEDAAPMN